MIIFFFEKSIGSPAPVGFCFSKLQLYKMYVFPLSVYSGQSTTDFIEDPLESRHFIRTAKIPNVFANRKSVFEWKKPSRIPCTTNKFLATQLGD